MGEMDYNDDDEMIQTGALEFAEIGLVMGKEGVWRGEEFIARTLPGAEFECCRRSSFIRAIGYLHGKLGPSIISCGLATCVYVLYLLALCCSEIDRFILVPVGDCSRLLLLSRCHKNSVVVIQCMHSFGYLSSLP